MEIEKPDFTTINQIIRLYEKLPEKDKEVTIRLIKSKQLRDSTSPIINFCEDYQGTYRENAKFETTTISASGKTIVKVKLITLQGEFMGEAQNKKEAKNKAIVSYLENQNGTLS